MKQLLIISLLCAGYLFVDVAEAADTTYSTITVKKKKKKSSGSSSSWSSSSDKEDDDDCFSTCLGDFVSSLFEKTPEEEAEAEARREKQRAARRRERAERQLFADDAKSDSGKNAYFDTPVHFMTGIKFGGGFFSEEVAQGFNAGMPFSLNFHPGEGVGFRLYTEFAFEGTQMNVDFERDIFIDGNPAGKQELITDDYQSILVPIRADIMLFPPFPKRGFFFTTGVGTQFSYDKLRGTLKSPSGEEAYEVSFKDWNPTIHAGIGGYINSLAIELGYNYTPLRDEGKVFVPSDNSSARHAIKFGVSISLF